MERSGLGATLNFYFKSASSWFASCSPQLLLSYEERMFLSFQDKSGERINKMSAKPFKSESFVLSILLSLRIRIFHFNLLLKRLE